MKPLKTSATALLILSLASSAIKAQIPWDIEIIKAEAIGKEPGFGYGFSPIEASNIHQLVSVTPMIHA